MKKTILAMAVPALLAAGSASASINLYDAEGVKVDASGAAEVQYIQDIGNNQDGKWRLDDGDFAINTEVAVSDKLSVIGAMAFEFENLKADSNDLENRGDVENDELYVGFKGDWGQFTAGRQYLLMDDSGITKDYELSVNSFGVDINQAAQVGKYVYDNGSFYGAVTYTDYSEGDDTTDDQTIYEGRLGYRIADVDARVYYQLAEDLGRVSDADTEAYNFEIEYAGIENVGIAASYGRTTDKTGATDVDTDYVSLAADYTMGKTTFGVGYDNQDADGTSTDLNGYYANVTYALHSNAHVYAELGDSDGDEQDFGYVAGMEVKF
ncbi:porin [Salinivibrio sp. ES.052]|uniref:porin n=1 Tax=Salinivibrio sp. ES.052 TaxID=1882823 RepID=UPI00092C2BE7|nr:porin [Salinivibrio sp. ES.052]SIN94965.1 Outer membrane protein (porin) [Salinivibrio sp. ES.052]